MVPSGNWELPCELTLIGGNLGLLRFWTEQVVLQPGSTDQGPDHLSVAEHWASANDHAEFFCPLLKADGRFSSSGCPDSTCSRTVKSHALTDGFPFS